MSIATWKTVVEGLEFRSQYLARLKRILEKVGVSGVLSKWSNLD